VVLKRNFAFLDKRLANAGATFADSLTLDESVRLRQEHSVYNDQKRWACAEPFFGITISSIFVSVGVNRTHRREVSTRVVLCQQVLVQEQWREGTRKHILVATCRK